MLTGALLEFRSLTKGPDAAVWHQANRNKPNISRCNRHGHVTIHSLLPTTSWQKGNPCTRMRRLSKTQERPLSSTMDSTRGPCRLRRQHIYPYIRYNKRKHIVQQQCHLNRRRKIHRCRCQQLFTLNPNWKEKNTYGSPSIYSTLNSFRLKS